MSGAALLARGLWWRRGFSLAILLVAVVTTTTAALGPTYARSASESVLRDHLTTAPAEQTGLSFQFAAGLPSAAKLSRVPAPGTVRGYPTSVLGMVSTGLAHALDSSYETPLNANVIYRQGFCAHFTMVSGHCPTADGQVMISQRTVDSGYGWHLGSPVDLLLGSPQEPGSEGGGRVTVVGVYKPRNTQEGYWFGAGNFSAAVGSGMNGDRIDGLFVARSELAALNASGTQVHLDLPLDPGQIRLAQVSALRSATDALRARFPLKSSATLVTGIGTVLDQAHHDQQLLDTATLLVTLELGLLSWLVLFQVIADASASRGNEIALAKLRGRSARFTLVFGVGEPMVLLLLAIPLGLAAAIGVTHVFAATALVSHTPVALTAPAVAAGFIAFAGGVVAALLASRRTLTLPVLEQWGRSRPVARHRVVTFVAELAFAALSVVTLVALHGRSASDADGGSVVLIAPGLFVFAVALLGVRLLPPACRALWRSTRSSGRIGLFLSTRQVGRRAAGLRLASLLAGALGLATFAVAGQAVFTANRDARAHAEIGAPQVASIQFDPKVDPIAAVDKADPGRRWAMATASFLPDGGNSVLGTVLGVDSTRLRAVGYSPPGTPSTSEVVSTIARAAVPAVTVTGTVLRVTLDAAAFAPADRPPTIDVSLRTPAAPFENVIGPSLQLGRHSYDIPVTWAKGCLFTGFVLDRQVGFLGAMTGTVTVSSIQQGDGTTFTTPAIRMTDPTAWRDGAPLADAHAGITVSAAGVHSQFSSTGGGTAVLAYAYLPDPLPALATPAAVNRAQNAPKPLVMLDHTGSSASFTVSRYVDYLPVVLTDGVVVDLDALRVSLPSFDTEADWSLWIGPHAPTDAIARLRAAGLTVQSQAAASARARLLGRQGPGLSLILLLGCAIAGSVLAVGAVAVSVGASSKRRSFEFAALRSVGVRYRSLLNAGITEQLLLLGTAVVLGVPAGIVAALIALPTIPEFASPTPISEDFTPSWLPVVVFVVSFVALLVVTAVVAAVVLLRAAVPSRLRTAEQ